MYEDLYNISQRKLEGKVLLNIFMQKILINSVEFCDSSTKKTSLKYLKMPNTNKLIFKLLSQLFVLTYMRVTWSMYTTGDSARFTQG